MKNIFIIAVIVAVVFGQNVPLGPFVPATEYRTITGVGNNIANPTLGTRNTPYLRVGGNFFYSDGISEPRCGGFTTNFTCPNERQIGIQFFNCPNCKDDGEISSDWAWAAGLFLAIETTRTIGNQEQFDIAVPPNDPVFTGPIAFKRQQHLVQAGPRVTTNAVSSFIDAHVIYGDHDNFTSFLRLGNDGLIATQIVNGQEYPKFIGSGALPTGVAFANLANNIPSSQMLRSGDGRGNQNPVLMAVQVLWVREHNRIARALKALSADPLSDEVLFQEARRRVIALMQHFYEAEYIPMLLGPNTPGAYTGYDANVDPSLDHMWATVALRYGHTQVSSATLRPLEDGTVLPPMILKDNFFDPTILLTDGVDSFWKGLTQKEHTTGEVSLIDDLRHHLYAKRGQLGGDLPSINMRRAREVGLPNFGEAKQIYGLTPVTTFAASFDAQTAALYESIYNTTDATVCDPWLCGFAEEGVNGGELGELFFTIILNQFNRLRTGDRFWYENNQFSAAELAEIKATKLSDIILRNSDLKSISCDIFKVNGTLCFSKKFPPPVATTGDPNVSSAVYFVYSIALIVSLLFVTLF